jgi:hypothetical protein
MRSLASTANLASSCTSSFPLSRALSEGNACRHEFFLTFVEFFDRFMERERRRAVELSLELLVRLKQRAFEELYDCQTKLEGLGQDVPAEMVSLLMPLPEPAFEYFAGHLCIRYSLHTIAPEH